MHSSTQVIAEIDRLVGAWCNRRCFRALRAILSGWPLASGLTDDWGELLDALEKVRAFGRSDLVDDELARVEDLIHDVHRILSGHPR